MNLDCQAFARISEQARFCRTPHFACADALQTLVKARIDMASFVREKPQPIDQCKSVFHGRLP